MVMNQEGAAPLVHSIVAQVKAIGFAVIGCNSGRHRSPTLGEVAKRLLEKEEGLNSCLVRPLPRFSLEVVRVSRSTCCLQKPDRFVMS